MVAGKFDTNGNLLLHVRNDQAGRGRQLQETRVQVVDYHRTNSKQQTSTVAKIRPAEMWITREAVNQLQHLEQVQQRMHSLAQTPAAGHQPPDSCTEAARWLADTMDLSSVGRAEPPHGPPRAHSQPRPRSLAATFPSPAPLSGAVYLERLVPRRPDNFSADMRNSLSQTATNWPYPLTGPVDGVRPEFNSQTWRGPRALNQARCRYISSMSLKHCDGDGSGRFRDGLSGSIRAGAGQNYDPFSTMRASNAGAALFRGATGTRGGPAGSPVKGGPGVAIMSTTDPTGRGPTFQFQ